jgi:hypothetical protein
MKEKGGRSNGGCYSPWRRYMQKLGFHFIVWTVFLKYLCGLMAQPANFISTHCWPVSQGVGREGMWKLIRSMATPLPSLSSLPLLLWHSPSVQIYCSFTRGSSWLFPSNLAVVLLCGSRLSSNFLAKILGVTSPLIIIHSFIFHFLHC